MTTENDTAYAAPMKFLESLPFALLMGAAGAIVSGGALLLVGYGFTAVLFVAAAGSIAGAAMALKSLGERKLPPSASFADFIAKDNE